MLRLQDRLGREPRVGPVYEKIISILARNELHSHHRQPVYF